MRKFNVNVNGKSYVVEVEETDGSAAPVSSSASAPVQAARFRNGGGRQYGQSAYAGTCFEIFGRKRRNGKKRRQSHCSRSYENGERYRCKCGRYNHVFG